MKNELFQAVAEVMKIETMAKGLKIVIHTNELPPEQMTAILSLYEKQGWFLFKRTSIKPDEIKNLPDIQLEENEKSPSQRLRSVLFVLWDQQGIKKSFEIYYREQMDKIITFVKEKLT